jgi:hypothetical protein
MRGANPAQQRPRAPFIHGFGMPKPGYVGVNIDLKLNHTLAAWLAVGGMSHAVLAEDLTEAGNSRRIISHLRYYCTAS